MRVALVKALRSADLRFTENSESLALGYLAAVLRADGHEVEIINGSLRQISNQHLLDRLSDLNPDLIGLTIPDPTLVHPSVELLRNLRSEGFRCPTVVGGHTVTFHAQDLFQLSSDIDFACLHEGETSFRELVRALDANRASECIPGIATRTGTTKAAQVPDLDALPYPARDDLGYVISHYPEVGAVPVLSSRGCYFRCGFCSVQAFYRQNDRPTWRRRTIDNVMEEIRSLRSTFAVRDILLVDDLFVSRSLPTQLYARDFAAAIRKEGLSFTLSATVDSINIDTFAPLAEAGLRQVYLGVESSSKSILRYLGKWFDPEDIEDAVEKLRELGICASVSFINFTPVTSISDLRANLRFFNHLGVNLLQGVFNRFQVYGGTSLFDSLRSAGSLVGKFPYYDYTDADEQVELAFRICTRSFRPLLDLASQLKVLERKCHLPFGVTGRQTCDKDLNSILRRHTDLKDLATQEISKDVASLFEAVLSFSEASNRDNQSLEGFIRDLQLETDGIYRGWQETLSLLEQKLQDEILRRGDGYEPVYQL